MPKRTNDFQKLVYLVRLNLAAGATVTESKMLRDRRTKRWREVDVCVKGHVGSHPVTVCIECRDHKRVADVTWVDAMKSKHERLETNALILASRTGFTPEARDAAKSYGIETFALEDVDKANFPALFGPQSSLWIKAFTVSVDKVTIRVAAVGELKSENVVTNPNNLLYTEDGAKLCQVRELVDKLIQSERANRYFLEEGTEEHKWAEIVWEPPRDHLGRLLYMQKIEPAVLRAIERIRIIGPCKIEIRQFGIRHGKFGDVHVAWGKTSIAGKEALAVATVAPTGEKRLSINFSGPTNEPTVIAESKNGKRRAVKRPITR